jgi:hypothetical protein
MTTVEHAEPDGVEELPDPDSAGGRLDQHHAPETNGWMSVCRRCGFATTGPQGHHAPHDQQLQRADSWLDAQVLNATIARMKTRRDT